MIFEICIDSVEAALAAQEAGAQRVELCGDLVEGGTTPSVGMLRVARKSVGIGIHVMIRPRGGDFCYSPVEFEVMKQDIRMAKDEGAGAVVIGLLRPDGSIDRERTRELVELARPLSVTFHRAFDLSRDPFESLEVLTGIGVDRVLTGGHAQKAVDGLDCLSRLVQLAGERMTILACGGINAKNVATVVRQTGAKEVHFAARKLLESPMAFRVPGLTMGSRYEPDEYTRRATDADLIREVIQAARL